jgi:predicted RNase H-like HicB family nuclease
VFAFKLRILDVGPNSYLGIVEGFPQILAHAESTAECEAQLTRLLTAYLEGLRDEDATQLQLDDFPTVRVSRLLVLPLAGNDYAFENPSKETSTLSGDARCE